MKKILMGLLIIVLMISFCLIGAANEVKVGFANYSLRPSWMRAYANLVERCEELGMEPIGIIGEEGYDNEVEALRELIQKDVDVLVISGLPRSYAYPLIEEAKANGVKCVGMCTDFLDVPNVRPPDIKVGIELGTIMLEHALLQGNVVMLQPGYELSEAMEQRSDFVRDMIKDWYPEMIISHSPIFPWPDPESEVVKITEDFLKENPEPKSIVGVIIPWGDEVGIPVAKTIMDMGRTEIAVVSCDGEEGAYKLIQQGFNYYTVDLNYSEIGRVTAEVCYKVANGAEFGKEVSWMNWIEPSTISTKEEATEKLKMVTEEDSKAKKILERFLLHG